jgi:hypothetical protein
MVQNQNTASKYIKSFQGFEGTGRKDDELLKLYVYDEKREGPLESAKA